MSHDARPVIGINLDLTAATKSSRPHLRLHPGYADLVLSGGGLPSIMPPFAREQDVSAFLDRVDGFLLTGGLDLDPRRHGQSMHASVRMMPERRADSDRMLVRQIIERQMPVLAVGVGMQQLNVACGGSLFLHLPEELPRSMPHFARDTEEPHRHLVILTPNTRLDEIYGVAEILATSCHHQAVKQIGSRFRPSAKAPDGVVEAIEAVDANWFAIGVQWHPEVESASALDLQLIECFVQSAIRNSQPLSLAA